MEEGKEDFRKHSSEVYSGKNLSVSKTSFFKNNTHLSLKPESGRKKLPYISRAKNFPIPVEKKYGFYRSDANSFMNHSCDKYGIKSRPHFVVNTTAATSLTDVPKVESGHDFNGNVSFSTHPALCNFTASVSEISSFNQVLSFQTNPHYEISLPKSIHHKQRTAYTEHRTFTPKVANSSNSFTSNRFFSAIPNPSIRCHCSKSVPTKFNSSEPYFKIPDRTSRENIVITEKYPKYVKYTLPDTCLIKDTSVKFNDLPIFETSSFPKGPSMTCKVDYNDDQLKQRNFPSKKWNPVPISKDVGKCLKGLDETDKMLFPALPSNHNQQGKSISSSANVPSEHSPIENSSLENVHSSDGIANTALVSSSATSTIPQASYADVIRMSGACSGTQGYVTLDHDKTEIPEHNQSSHSSVDEKQPNEDNSQPDSSDWVISRLSQIDLNAPDSVNSIALTSSNQNGQNLIASRPIVVSLEKPSFYNSSLQTCKSVLNALSSTSLPDKKVIEDHVVVDYLTNLDKISLDNNSSLGSTNRSSVSSDFATSITDRQAASIKTDSVYSSPSSVSSSGDAFKPIENQDLIIDNIFNKVVPPVIIMDNCSSGNITEISFGIEFDEMLKLCSDHGEGIVPLTADDSENFCSDKKLMTDSLHINTSKLPESVAVSLQSEVEMPNCSTISVKGRNLYWKNPEIDYNGSNHLQLTEYFSGGKYSFN